MTPMPQDISSVALQPIPAVSPSLAELIRNCPLQAGLSRISALNDYVLGNPKAWLGTAYHDVLENLWTKHPELPDDELIEQLWSRAIERLVDQASTHPLNSRYGTPQHWPGYNLARAFVQIRAKQALANRPRSRNTPSSTSGGTTLREEKMWAMDGKLTGKPDVVAGNEIHDYKSGQILEISDDGQEVVKQIYVNQLLLYGHLVHEETGQCPAKGTLLPMQGHPVEVNLDPSSCAAAAHEAVSFLDDYNEGVATVSEASDLATPSPAACRWCRYKSLCEAFWHHVREDWIEELGSAAVCGRLTRAPQVIHNGQAYAISLSVAGGTTSEQEVVIAPLDGSVHGQVGDYNDGDSLRIINLFRRRDGRLAPTVATVCMRTADCPSVLNGRVGETPS